MRDAKKVGQRQPDDIGGMGASFFRLIAKDAGLVANESNDDKAGWDFEVETPSPLTINYSSHSRSVYRIQVKATIGDGNSVRLTISSLLSLIQFGGPAFVFFARFDNGVVPNSAYLLHIDEALTLEVLTSLRKRHLANSKIKLNKATFTLHFEQKTQLRQLTGTELKNRLDASLSGPYLKYLERKTKWLLGIEEDSTRWRASLLLENDKAIRAMADCFLGYEKPFNVSSIVYLAPLGIPDKKLEHSREFLPTTIAPVQENLTKAKIRLSTSEYGVKHDFQGRIYTVPHSFPKQYRAARFQSDLFDLTIRLDKCSVEFFPKDLHDAALRCSVKELSSFADYMAEALNATKTYFEVIPADGTPPLKLSLETHSVTVTEGFQDLRRALNMTYLKLVALGLNDEIMSPSHLFDRPGIFGFLAHVGETYNPPLTIEFPAPQTAQSESNVTVFSNSIEFAKNKVLFFAAFYGSVKKTGGGLLSGTYVRSEYLGELIAPIENDWTIMRKTYSENFEESLKKKGFVVT